MRPRGPGKLIAAASRTVLAMLAVTGRSHAAVWLVALAAAVGLAGCGGDDHASAPPPLAALPVAAPVTAGNLEATVVGDSVASAIAESPEAQAVLQRGMHTNLDLHACRRLVGASCTFQGAQPSTALDAVKQRGNDLGSVLVIDVGYNDQADDYAASIDEIMRAARAQHAQRVVWLTLHEAGPGRDDYRASNEQIRAAARRWPQLRVADWNAYSQGKPWFGGDDLHLSPDGGLALATFMRRYMTAGT